MLKSNFREPALEKQIDGGYILWIETFPDSSPVNHANLKDQWFVSLALDGNIEVNRQILSKNFWSISYAKSSANLTIRPLSGKGHFLCIFLYEPTFLEYKVSALSQSGPVSSLIMDTVLGILSRISSQVSHPDIWIKSYLILLLTELCNANLKRSPFEFEEMRKVYHIVESLSGIANTQYPTPSQVIQRSQMQTHRFQRACLEMYGTSIQSIIQHLKMKKAFEDIVQKNRDVATTSTELGFTHSGNFVTAFRKHFGITPTFMFPFYRPSSTPF
jgi:AraC-like DNA-binding protein